MAKADTDKMAEWFASVELPKGPLSVQKGETIVDPGLYVERNLSGLRACDNREHGDGRRVYSLCWMRLYRLKKYIDAESGKKAQ